ncbi:MAG TPA: hypothetical protein VK937_00555 [Candidatus Limnocylindria bacterium]|jgi:hypothetical protein|nr:hypothetical protein [Candidatus Limnocylindria bacterium]
MSDTSNPALSQPEGLGKKLRQLAVGTLFALVLIIPKILHVRRNPRSWMLFRIFLGVAGAALVVLPLGLGTSFVPAIVGLAMFISAILLPPAKPNTNAGDKAHELGALVVVNGGRFQPGRAAAAAVQHFVSAESVWVLDQSFQPLLEIPVSEITAACAEQSEESWRLRVTWASHTAEFSYGGIFAEHLARVAESTIRGVMRPALPVLPQRRAAGA